MKTPVGLYLAPFIPLGAWSLMTQAGQVLPYFDCDQRRSWTMVAGAVSVVLAVIAVTWGILDCRVAQGKQRSIAYLSCAAGTLFTFALVLQGASTVLVNPCEQ
jgi:hypothetical protein